MYVFFMEYILIMYKILEFSLECVVLDVFIFILSIYLLNFKYLFDFVL